MKEKERKQGTESLGVEREGPGGEFLPKNQVWVIDQGILKGEVSLYH